MRSDTLPIKPIGSQPPPDTFKSSFEMIIHQPNGKITMRRCKLDTGSVVDVISEEVVSACGMEMQVYNGPMIEPIGKAIKPIGQVKFG